MRKRHPIGTKLKVWGKIKNTPDSPHLYTSYQWKYDVLSDSEADAFIKAKQWNVQS